MMDAEQVYAPPASPAPDEERDGHAPPPEEPGETEPASRLTRLLAAAIDLGFVFGVVQASTFVVRRELLGDGVPDLGVPPHIGQVLTIVGWTTRLLAFAAQGALIARRGQSLGKVALRLRIVLEDGRTAGLLRGFVLRTLPFWAVVLAVGQALPDIPPDLRDIVIGMVQALLVINVALILGAGRRCGHDLLAGTRVIKLRRPNPTPQRFADDEEEDAPRRRKKKATGARGRPR